MVLGNPSYYPIRLHLSHTYFLILSRGAEIVRSFGEEWIEATNRVRSVCIVGQESCPFETIYVGLFGFSDLFSTSLRFVVAYFILSVLASRIFICSLLFHLFIQHHRRLTTLFLIWSEAVSLELAYTFTAEVPDSKFHLFLLPSLLVWPLERH